MAPSCQIPLHILDVDAATDPTIQAVHDYWCGLNAGLPPRRKAFEFMDIYKAAPNLLLAERLEKGDIRFIYCGTAVAENIPRDLTGLVFTRRSARITAVDFEKTYAEILDTPCWHFARWPVDWPNTEYSDYLLGGGPLTDDAGKARYVLTCSVFVKKSPYTSRV